MRKKTSISKRYDEILDGLDPETEIKQINILINTWTNLKNDNFCGLEDVFEDLIDKAQLRKIELYEIIETGGLGL